MMKRSLGLFALTLIWALPAHAESKSPNPELAEAERSYQAVDFPATRAEAQKALEAGGATPTETARLHVLLGISAAALGDSADAKQHFIAALAVDPGLHLDKTLSPKIRDPYLEAQGYWSAAGDRLALSATPSADGAHLVVRLQDPASLVAKIELRVGAAGAREHSSFSLDPAPEGRFSLPASVRERSYEFVLRAVDRYGNALAERGSEADPELVQPGTRAATSTAAIARPGRSYLFPVALAVAGVGAVAAGVVFNVKRERAARDWNGPSCENPGATRIAQCSDVNSRVQTDERLAIGFYAGGGALLVGSVISLVAGRPAPAPTERASSLGTRSLGCTLTGPGVSCLGRF
ncbi:MAG TPA: hypothetical protein VHV51_12695 [Polyangiaceae bacterium]|jgi:hypothetical protein|nr:hypothetical protein [Polyangiaceae bacterium]